MQRQIFHIVTRNTHYTLNRSAHEHKKPTYVHILYTYMNTRAHISKHTCPHHYITHTYICM